MMIPGVTVWFKWKISFGCFLSESSCVVETSLMVFELDLINGLLQVAACRSLPALQVATRKLHVTLTTKAAEVSFLQNERCFGSTWSNMSGWYKNPEEQCSWLNRKTLKLLNVSSALVQSIRWQNLAFYEQFLFLWCLCWDKASWYHPPTFSAQTHASKPLSLRWELALVNTSCSLVIIRLGKNCEVEIPIFLCWSIFCPRLHA